MPIRSDNNHIAFDIAFDRNTDFFFYLLERSSRQIYVPISYISNVKPTMAMKAIHFKVDGKSCVAYARQRDGDSRLHVRVKGLRERPDLFLVRFS